MNKLILCSGLRTARPYGFASAGIRVYSIEELCYFLFHHVYLIDEDMLSNALFDWIGTELKLTDRAEKLKLLKQQRADLKTLVTVILCSADYYSEQEIKEVIRALNEIEGMPFIKRYCWKAGKLLADQKYREAMEEYEKIMASGDIVSLSPEDYGNLLHNLAVIKLYLSGWKEASELFYQAYERNHRRESLEQLLLCLQLSGEKESYMEMIDKYQVSEELQNVIHTYLEQKQEELQNSEIMKKVQLLRQKKEQGVTDECYEMADQMIDEWKEELRRL